MGAVRSPTTDAVAQPSDLEPAPALGETPLPGSFTLGFDSTSSFDDGAVLMGGSPLRLWRLSPRAQNVVGRWRSGQPVGNGRAGGLLARRLASAGAAIAHPNHSLLTAEDVTVVIPVRDRPRQLERLLTALDGLSCIVVDDQSEWPERSRQVAEHHGARFLALDTHLGPSAARNAGWKDAGTPLVAFVDSDCVPSAGWLEPLLGYFDDPMVAAVAPRVTPGPVLNPTAVSRYEWVRSSLDRGARRGLVRAQSTIPYVPSAALVVRREVAGPDLFDPCLHAGEDVDLVWRLGAVGWNVHYEPSSRVQHDGPASAREFLARRAFYGTSAAPLSERHPDVMAPLQTSVWSGAVWVLGAARRPFLALSVLATSVIVLARRLQGLVRDPLLVSGRIAGGGTTRSAMPALSGLARAWSPALALGLISRRTRGSAAAALLIPAISDWIEQPGDLDLLRYAVLHVADDLAYGSGVWAGCARGRTVRPLVPRLLLRSRVWSSDSLHEQLREAEVQG